MVMLAAMIADQYKNILRTSTKGRKARKERKIMMAMTTIGDGGDYSTVEGDDDDGDEDSRRQ